MIIPAFLLPTIIDRKVCTSMSTRQFPIYILNVADYTMIANKYIHHPRVFPPHIVHAALKTKKIYRVALELSLFRARTASIQHTHESNKELKVEGDVSHASSINHFVDY